MANGKRLAWGLALLTWGLLIGVGLRIQEKYSTTPGAIETSLRSWPKTSHIPFVKNSLPTLLVFLHPKCPCSSATLRELGILMARTNGKANVYAVFAKPKSWTVEEVKGRLWKNANKIRGVKVFIDESSVEAKGFGALTSGHAALFNSNGDLVFTGGITAGRGHEGDNPGLSSIANFIHSGSTLLPQSKVFGCALYNREAKATL